LKSSGQSGPVGRRGSRWELGIGSGQVEQVSFKSGIIKERGWSDGWCDGGDRWWTLNEVDGMRQEDYSKDWVMHNDKREEDAWGWTSYGDTTALALQRVTLQPCFIVIRYSLGGEWRYWQQQYGVGSHSMSIEYILFVRVFGTAIHQARRSWLLFIM